MNDKVNRISPAEPAAIAHAAAVLRRGGLVGFPTETVYGLGADATSGKAVAGIFAAKGRPRFNPLIVHLGSLAEAERQAQFPPMARRLAEKFWPGALTLVLPRRADSTLSELVSAGLDTVALRLPAHPVAKALLREAGLPIRRRGSGIRAAPGLFRAFGIRRRRPDRGGRHRHMSDGKNPGRDAVEPARPKRRSHDLTPPLTTSDNI